MEFTWCQTWNLQWNLMTTCELTDCLFDYLHFIELVSSHWFAVHQIDKMSREQSAYLSLLVIDIKIVVVPISAHFLILIDHPLLAHSDHSLCHLLPLLPLISYYSISWRYLDLLKQERLIWISFVDLAST